MATTAANPACTKVLFFQIPVSEMFFCFSFSSSLYCPPALFFLLRVAQSTTVTVPLAPDPTTFPVTTTNPRPSSWIPCLWPTLPPECPFLPFGSVNPKVLPGDPHLSSHLVLEWILCLLAPHTPKSSATEAGSRVGR